MKFFSKKTAGDHPKEPAGLDRVAKMRRFSFEEDWSVYIRFDFMSDEDHQYFREMVTPYCMIAWPELNKDFQVLGRLGVGS
jgi:hypothetical protein